MAALLASAAGLLAHGAVDPAAVSGGLDLRVTRGLGPKGYGRMRVSAVTHGPREFADFAFEYSQPFRYRWTTWLDAARNASQPDVPARWLHSSLVDLGPGGGERTLTIGGRNVTLRLPPPRGASRGLLLSDPCFTPPAGTQRWIDCEFSERWQTFNRTVALLNSALGPSPSPPVDYWMVLGDNFYDQNGAVSDVLMGSLSLAAKSTPLAVVAGNHDMWIPGGPDKGDEFDQHGIGTMQYYAVDPAASLGLPPSSAPGAFLDFSVDPDATARWNSSLNTAANLVWYHAVGDVGFIGASGAFPESALAPHLDAACAWLAALPTAARPRWLFLLGHWDGDGGATAEAECNPCLGADTPALHARLRHTPGCAEYGSRLKYQDGHTHCNRVQEVEAGTGEARGFLVGASGMSGCSQFGFEYVETEGEAAGEGGAEGGARAGGGGALRVWYFELEREGAPSRADAVLSCVAAQGLPACTHLATLWFDSAAARGTTPNEAQE